MRTVFLNGRFVPEASAKVSVFDRGLLFGQSIYEVSPVIGGRFCNWSYHAARLENSKAIAGIIDDTDWPAVLRKLIELNQLREGRVYLQITAGAPSQRDFLLEQPRPEPNRIAFTQEAQLLDDPRAQTGLKVILQPDIRWQLRSAKTTQLLGAVIAKQAAREAGVDDAWLVENGVITEATSSNAHIINRRGVLISHPVDHGVLPGVTRICLLEHARRLGIPVEERPFTPDELIAAREAFVSAAGSLILGVVEVDGRPIGDGRPGPQTMRLREVYIDALRAAG